MTEYVFTLPTSDGLATVPQYDEVINLLLSCHVVDYRIRQEETKLRSVNVLRRKVQSCEPERIEVTDDVFNVPKWDGQARDVALIPGRSYLLDFR